VQDATPRGRSEGGMGQNEEEERKEGRERGKGLEKDPHCKKRKKNR